MRISNDVVQTWNNDVRIGARGMLATGDGTVGLLGGYEPHEKETILLGHAGEDGSIEAVATLRLQMPDGSPVPERRRAAVSGDTLHLLIDSEWFSYKLTAA